ncbi:hypothetical protein ACGFOU_07570 [Streptomyces sp. NPDC048595]|uniref:hypothetical protein n=1 Tax=Streptomyces sp. NPDC048595 TaxID=3365576 RepID=UPI0037111ED5
MSTTPEPEQTPGPEAAAAAATDGDGSGAQAPAAAPVPRPARRPAARLIFDDPLNQQSSDDTDRGWGERPAGGDSAADLARFLDEKPPHHL